MVPHDLQLLDATYVQHRQYQHPVLWQQWSNKDIPHKALHTHSRQQQGTV